MVPPRLAVPHGLDVVRLQRGSLPPISRLHGPGDVNSALHDYAGSRSGLRRLYSAEVSVFGKEQ